MRKPLDAKCDNKRSIRSFVKRAGRMTDAQKRAIEQHWHAYGLNCQDKLIDWQAVFGREAPRVLEIGFGNGDALLQMAERSSETDHIGIDVHEPGVGKLLSGLAEKSLNNVRVFCDDAVFVLSQCIPDASLARIHIFFPDPWPKKRHHKRRLIQSAFVDLCYKKLKPQGVLHLATDWQDYAEHMRVVMAQHTGFKNVAGSGKYSPRPASRPLTKFEKRGQALGHDVWDLLFEKVSEG